MKRLALALALGAALPAAAEVHGEEALFADANAAFLSGDLSRAVATYEALVAEGVASPELETNLGVALFRQGRRGHAALHFERALFLRPGDEDARADLAELRKQNVDRLEGADEGSGEAVARALAPLPGSPAAALLCAAWCAAWTLLAIRLLRPRNGTAGIAAAGCFALTIAAGALTWGAAAGRDLAFRRAVVVAPSTLAREGPAESAASHFEVHEGTPLRVEDQQGQWLRVKLGNGLTGWVPHGTIDLVVPPGWAGRPVLAGSPRAQLR